MTARKSYRATKSAKSARNVRGMRGQKANVERREEKNGRKGNAGLGEGREKTKKITGKKRQAQRECSSAASLGWVGLLGVHKYKR